MKKTWFLLVLITYYLVLPRSVFAEYVMPYPSYMPGNSVYRTSRILDKFKYYWFWGNIAQVKYHLSLSDKYLIEAKTLMEYKQYLLGADALRRSDQEFVQLPKYVAGAKKEGVNVAELQHLVTSASDKHVEILTDLLANTPAQFIWTPEKARSTDLHLSDTIKASIGMRRLWCP